MGCAQSKEGVDSAAAVQEDTSDSSDAVTSLQTAQQVAGRVKQLTEKDIAYDALKGELKGAAESLFRSVGILVPGATVAMDVCKFIYNRHAQLKLNDEAWRKLKKKVESTQKSLASEERRRLPQTEEILALPDLDQETQQCLEEAVIDYKEACPEIWACLVRIGRLQSIVEGKTLSKRALKAFGAKTIQQSLGNLSSELDEGKSAFFEICNQQIQPYINPHLHRLNGAASGSQKLENNKSGVVAPSKLGRTGTLIESAATKHADATPVVDDTAHGDLRELLQIQIDIADDLERHLKLFHPGTRQWVFQKLTEWREQGHDVAFWLNGSGGLGKSVIAAEFFRQCQEDTKSIAAAAAFFCRHNDGLRNNARTMLCSLAFQLAHKLPSVANQLHDQRAEIQGALNDQSTSVEQLFELLLRQPLEVYASAAKQPGMQVVLVVDALDEMQANAQRLMLLNLIGKRFPTLPNVVKVLVTSRPEDDIVNCLHKLNPMKLVKVSQAVDKDSEGEDFSKDKRQLDDVKMFLHDKLESLAYVQKHQDAFSKELDALTAATEGVFLVARFMVLAAQELESTSQWPAEPKAAIRELCKVNLDGTYTETLGRITTRLKEQSERAYPNVRKAFQSILNVLVCSAAPLPMKDVVTFASSYDGQRSSALTKQLMNALSLMFTQQEHSGTVEPIHKTVTDFLVSKAAGDMQVDRFEGFTTLSLSTANILLKQLPATFDQSQDFSPALCHALLFGHIYVDSMLDASSAIKDQSFQGQLDDVLEQWHELFLVERKDPRNLEFLLPQQEGKSAPLLSESACEANDVFAKWIMAQVALSPHRRYDLRGELTPLCKQLASHCSSSNDGRQLQELFDTFRKLFALHWAPNADCTGFVNFASNTPLTSSLHGITSWSTLLKHHLQPRYNCFLTIPQPLGLNSLELALTGHSGFVTSVAFSPDGKTIVSGSADKTVCLWDATSGTQLHQLEGHSDNVTSVAYSPDGKTIVSGSVDKMVCLWDATSGTQLHEMKGHSDAVIGVAFSPAGKTIVSGSLDMTVRLWDATSGTQLRELNGHSDNVSSVAFSPDGKKIVSGSADNTVRLWEATSGSQLHQLEDSDAVTSVAFSPDGKTIVSGSGDKTVRIWDATSGTQLHEMKGHSGTVKSVAFSPDGKTIVSGSFDMTVRIWDATSGTELHQLEGQPNMSVAFSPDSKTIVAGSIDNTVRIWDATSGTQLRKLDGHSGDVWSVALSLDGKAIVSGSADKTVRLWEANSGTLLHEMKGHLDHVMSVAFSPDGKTIVSGSTDSTVRIWDATSGTQLHQLEGHSDVLSVAFSPDGKTIISGSADQTARLWDATSGTELRKLGGHWDALENVAFSPDGKTIVSGSFDKTVCLWDATQLHQLEGHSSEATSVAFSPDGKIIHRYLLHQLEGHSGVVTSVAFSPDSKTIVSGSKDKTVRLWDATSGTQLHQLEGHSDTVVGVAFSLDGKTIVSGSNDKSVRLWDATSGTELHQLDGILPPMSSVAFSPDGKRIISGSADRTVRLWEVNPGSRIHD